MPNGKGSLECCYCTHWQGEYRGYEGAYEEGFCLHHRSTLPSTLNWWGHRVCSAFNADPSYERDSPTISVQTRFSWFGEELAPGILYVFPYNQPDAIEQLTILTEES